MRVAIALFTRDLRVHDNPALAAAVEAAETVTCLAEDGSGLTASPRSSGRYARAGEVLTVHLAAPTPDGTSNARSRVTAGLTGKGSSLGADLGLDSIRSSNPSTGAWPTCRR